MCGRYIGNEHVMVSPPTVAASDPRHSGFRVPVLWLR